MKIKMILTILVLLIALNDAKRKGKKKSHKKKSTSIEPQNTDTKPTLFPKPDKRVIASDKPNEHLTTINPLLSTNTILTSEGLAGSTGSKESVRTAGSVGSTNSVGSMGSVGSTVSTSSTLALAESASSVGSSRSVGSAVTLSANQGETTLIQTNENKNNNITTALTKLLHTSTTTEAMMDFADEDELENEVYDNTFNDLSFMRDFRLSTDENNLSKYEQDDYDTFTTEMMPADDEKAYKRKRRQLRRPNGNFRDKRSNNIVEEENLGTTLSGFKFTGRESRSSDKSVYNNINV